jgi:hypothetical protein
VPIILPSVVAGQPMTFVELQNEVILTRFRESQRASIQRWINWRYQWVNSQADWPWISPSLSTLAWTGSAQTMDLDEELYRRLVEVWDDDNDVPLMYRPLDDFLRIYGGPRPGTSCSCSGRLPPASSWRTIQPGRHWRQSSSRACS